MPRRALRILVVEDQLIIAKQLEMIAAAAGHRVVGTAMTVHEACQLLCTTDPDIVLLDISLAEGDNGVDVADYVAGHSHARVVFTTANRRRLPQDYCGAIGVIEKPFTRAGVQSALAFVAARIGDERHSLAEPASLQLSPAYRLRWTQQGA